MKLSPTRLGGVLGGALLAVTTAVAPAPAVAAPPAPQPVRGCGAGTAWEMSTDKLDPSYTRHAFVGNGYLSQRVPPRGMGYVSTGEKTGFPLETPRYDGAYVAGLYANGPASQSDEKLNSYAAIPTWSTLTVGTGGATYTPKTPRGQISNYHQTLNVRCGLLRTSLTWTTPDGRATDLVYEVVADRAHAHVGAVRVRMTPHWQGRATVAGVIDGAGARRMHPTGGGSDGRTTRVGFETDGVGETGTVASTLRADPKLDGDELDRGQRTDGLTARQSLSFSAQRGKTYEFSKYVGVNTSVSTPEHRAAAVKASKQAAERGWDDMFAEHAQRWQRLWESNIRVPGEPRMQKWLRGTKYAVLSSVREGQDHSVAPAGLSSDNYAGLVFWDAELWIMPSLLLQHPDLAKSIVDYRERTLEQARVNAEKIGERGSFYPWTSADDGNLWSDCHSWDPPHCLTQNHLQGDIAFATWQYYLATGDEQWLRENGWPVLRNVAEYWAGRVTPNPDGSYSINNVAGPDEYSNGVDDGVFTNAVAATSLRRATDAAELLGEPAPAKWTEIADHLRIPFNEREQVFKQYAGYQGGEIKQADTVLLQYPLEWPMSPEVASNTLEYYAPRTDPDGPAMTDAIHAIDAAANGQPGCVTNTYLQRSVRPFMREPFAQFSEARGEQAGEGAGAPALNFLTGGGGFMQVFTHGLPGLRLRADGVKLDPMLPPQLSEGVELNKMHWQGRTFDVHVGPHSTTVTLHSGEPFTVHAPDGEHLVSQDSSLTLKTRRPDLSPTSNVARCKTAEADSVRPGRYAMAAVDGSTATSWVPKAPESSLTVDLGSKQRITDITTRWTDLAPASSRVLTSVDGEHFTEVPPKAPGARTARYVRVELTDPQGEGHAGIRELEVTRAPR